MVSGCVGFVGVFALTFRLWRSLWAGFVRKVSSFFQVVAISFATCAASDSAIDKFSFSDPMTRPERQCRGTLQGGSAFSACSPERMNLDATAVAVVSSTGGTGSSSSAGAESACLLRAGSSARLQAPRSVVGACPETHRERVPPRRGAPATSVLRLRTCAGPHRAERSSRLARYRSTYSQASVPRPASASSSARSSDACSSARSWGVSSSSMTRTSTSAPSGKSVGSSSCSRPFLT